MSERINIPFTNEHFMAFCLKMVGQPYWFGTCLYRCTTSLLTRKTEQYPSAYTASRENRYKQDIAAKKVCADCIGAAKGYAWSGGGQGVLEAIGTGRTFTTKYQSNGCPDKGADSMFAYAKAQGMDWGTIDTIPEIPGIAVHKSGHIGYYLGNGGLIEWRGFSYGCVRAKLKDRTFKHWYKLPFIQYGEAGVTIPDTVAETDITAETTNPAITSTRLLSYTEGRRMLKGDDVLALQVLLNALGFDCGKTDGIFGPITQAGVLAFQAAYQLEVDGIVGPKTRQALASTVQPKDKPQGSQGLEAEMPADEHVESTKAFTPTQTVYVQVNMTRQENIDRFGAGVVSVDIEEYLRGVVPSEMYASANIEALKAQAIAARTYAYKRRNSVLSDTTASQSLRALLIGKYPRVDEAVQTTAGHVLTYDGKTVDCFYSASNHGITKRSGDVWKTHYPYYVSKLDEWDINAREERNVTHFGHGVGMSQHGAMWAARNGVSHDTILAFYYEGAMITDNYGL